MESKEEQRARLKKQLDDTHQWPCAFTFKFILPTESDSESRLKGVFGSSAQFRHRPSRNGRYLAFTIIESVSCAEDVFQRYEDASSIPGIISL